jgi:hypothetical protein
VGRNNSTAFVFELNPQSGGEFFGFDSTGGFAEAHAIERSRRVFTAGSYTFFVQFRVDNADIAFGLDDWHFAVDMHS